MVQISSSKAQPFKILILNVFFTKWMQFCRNCNQEYSIHFLNGKPLKNLNFKMSDFDWSTIQKLNIKCQVFGSFLYSQESQHRKHREWQLVSSNVDPGYLIIGQK